MDIPRDFFRGFFGFPGLHPRHPVYDDEYDEDDGNDDYEGESNGEPQDFHDRESFHFKVITDPLEIHKFFEHQMDDMMKNFGRGFGFGSGIPGFGTGEFKEQEDDKWTMVPPSDPRDFMLRDNERKPDLPVEDNDLPRVDTDLDNQDIPFDGLAKLFPGDKNYAEDRNPVGKRHLFPGNKNEEQDERGAFGFGSLWGGLGETPGSVFRSFGSSQSQQTMRRSDGSVETKSTIRDSSGTEITTVKRKLGNQEHISTVKKDKDGTEERSDTFVNLDDNALDDFNKKWSKGDGRNLPIVEEERDTRLSPRRDMMSPSADRLYGSLFDKFFGR